MQSFVEFLEDHGPLGLMIHSFLDAVIFPIPAFFTQVSLSMVNPQSALLLATLGFIACLVGTPIGYMIGRLFGISVLSKLVKKEWIDKGTHIFQTKGSVAILFGAFTPIPFKVFTILSGALKYPLWQLIGYAAIGRAAKFYVVGTLFYIYGRNAENMMSNVSLYVALGAIPVLIIFLLVRRAILKKKAAKKAAEAIPAPGVLPATDKTIEG